MPPRVGIGIITYNRRDIVARTIARAREYTRYTPMALVVADDGSTDGTPAMLRSLGVCCVTGPNRGIAWNKNRALYALVDQLACNAVILLEDDTEPAAPGWEADWIAAVSRWGHVNYAAPWLRDRFLSGSGTVDDPVIGTSVTAQCAAFSRTALAAAGYFEPRFKGYGHEHVEHTSRLLHRGFGGHADMADGTARSVFYLIDGNVVMREVPSTWDAEQEARNLQLAHELMRDKDRCPMPWRDDAEKAEFQAEIAAALAATPNPALIPNATI